MTREEKAIIYFKDMRKRLCEDYLLGVPKDSVAYKATMTEKEFYDAAIKALEQEPVYYPPCIDCNKKMNEIRNAYDNITTKAQKQESILDKIRAEIVDCLKALDDIEKSGFNIYLPNEMSGRRLTYQQCLEFIDKYEAVESEKNNGKDDKREST